MLTVGEKCFSWTASFAACLCLRSAPEKKLFHSSLSAAVTPERLTKGGSSSGIFSRRLVMLWKAPGLLAVLRSKVALKEDQSSLSFEGSSDSFAYSIASEEEP